MHKDTERRGLYPSIEPNHAGHLEVGDGHEIYYEESGNPHGKPAVFLPWRSWWWLYTKRCGASSIPMSIESCSSTNAVAVRASRTRSLENNTTWDLVNDIEILRSALRVDRWQVFGGSWGSTLALAYAQSHPDRVTELVLRGIFLLRKKEIQWLYQKAPANSFRISGSTIWSRFRRGERGDMLGAYYKRLTSDDTEVRLEAAKAWSIWEASTSFLVPNEKVTTTFGGHDLALSLARIECHYFVNGGFMKENQLLDNIDKVRNIPAVIVQGRYDVVCPMVSAWELAQAWPEADFRIVPDAGHAAFETGNIHELIMATDAFAAN